MTARESRTYPTLVSTYSWLRRTERNALAVAKHLHALAAAPDEAAALRLLGRGARGRRREIAALIEVAEDAVALARAFIRLTGPEQRHYPPPPRRKVARGRRVGRRSRAPEPRPSPGTESPHRSA